MLTAITWRHCPKCGKSFDGVYLGSFGCRACGHAESVTVVTVVESGGLPSVTAWDTRETRNTRHVAARSPGSSGGSRFPRGSLRLIA